MFEARSIRGENGAFDVPKTKRLSELNFLVILAAEPRVGVELKFKGA